jgi:hypothetical protein
MDRRSLMLMLTPSQEDPGETPSYHFPRRYFVRLHAPAPGQRDERDRCECQPLVACPNHHPTRPPQLLSRLPPAYPTPASPTCTYRPRLSPVARHHPLPNSRRARSHPSTALADQAPPSADTLGSPRRATPDQDPAEIGARQSGYCGAFEARRCRLGQERRWRQELEVVSPCLTGQDGVIMRGRYRSSSTSSTSSTSSAAVTQFCIEQMD